MPKVDLIAVKDFTYNTRRLVAGDSFQARNRDDAKILIELLGKARMGRPAAEVPPPPPEVAEKLPPILTTKEVLGAEVVEESASKKPAKATKAGARARRAKAKK